MRFEQAKLPFAHRTVLSTRYVFFPTMKSFRKDETFLWFKKHEYRALQCRFPCEPTKRSRNKHFPYQEVPLNPLFQAIPYSCRQQHAGQDAEDTAVIMKLFSAKIRIAGFSGIFPGDRAHITDLDARCVNFIVFALQVRNG